MPGTIIHKSLATEAAELLRERINTGEYADYLLPERRLAADLGVSRPTLREALTILEKDGWLKHEGRQVRKIIPCKTPRRSARHLRIRLLQNNSGTSFLNEHLQTLEFLAEHLCGHEVEFAVDTCPGCFTGKPDAALERLVNQRKADVWILYMATESIQHWFHARSIPCVVLGSCFAGIKYPSIDEDFAATCHHAAGLFLSHGHRQLVLLTSNRMLPGDLVSMEGFRQGCQQRRSREGVEMHHSMHDRTPAGICRVVAGLLEQDPVPTGWLILNSQTYFTVASYLATRGLRVGQDISLISRNSDPYFETLVPTVAHYTRQVIRMNKQLLQAVLRVGAGDSSAKSQRRVTSIYTPGDSLGRWRKPPRPLPSGSVEPKWDFVHPTQKPRGL